MIDILNHNFTPIYSQFYTNYLVQGLAIDLLGEGVSKKTSQQTQ
jgi:hypothetical protein